MTTTEKMMISFTAGLVMGILYAPARGSKTRFRLNNLGNDLKGKWNDATDSLANKIDNVRNSMDAAANKAIEKVESAQFSSPNWKDI